MKFAILFLLVLSAATPLFSASDPFAEGVRTTEPLTPEQQQKTFKLPPGFTVQLVAAEPELRKPMNMAFDGAGRLWITESREYPWATNTSPRDTIRIFSDFDADGRARKVTTFATNLNIPIGLYPFQSPASDGSGKPTFKCIAWSIPNIWLFEDIDGDGVADKKDKFLGPFDFTRDTHGNQASFRRGLDGWIYATHGYNNRSRVASKDGHEVFMTSGNTYRFRIDGSRIEHWAHGQVNPFGLTFDALGNLYSADCHSSPIYQLLRGAWYPSFGAPDDGLGFAPTTIQHSHGSTAICGITMLDDETWPEEFRGNLIIGNVMTSCINRDRVEWRGSTSVGHEMPDFVTVTDPWFRPVDLQLGPDGALWVADFYNRIIGHYEVPLTHPGRDRERGRIWRIVPPKGADLAKLKLNDDSAKLLVGELGMGNRTRRALVMQRLADRFPKDAANVDLIYPWLVSNISFHWSREPERAVDSPLAQECIARLWLRNRFGNLSDKDVETALRAPLPNIRMHALRVATDRGLQSASIYERQGAGERRSGINAALRSAVEAALQDSDAHVQRAGADALGANPSAANIQPLIALLERAPAADTHLRHVVRIALRDSLMVTKDFVAGMTVDAKTSRALADVAPAVTNSAAASFLVAHLQKYSEPRRVAAQYLKHAARFLPEDRIDDLASLARDKFRDDIDLQTALFKSVQEGLQQRGVALSSRVKSWGSALSAELLASVRHSETEWIALPVESNPNSANPWAMQRRKCSDGKEADFLCTLPAGEQLTGVLRSKNFAVPAKLTFWMAGHDGFPDKPLQKKNLVRLRDADSFDVLKEAPAPRNDTAGQVIWDLSQHAGRQAFLELADGDTAGAFAWLAVGRFEPAVVSLPKITPKVLDDRLQAAAQFALVVRDHSLEPQLVSALKMPAGADARAAVATTLLALNSKQHLAGCSEILNDASAPTVLRQKIAQVMADSNNDDARTALMDVVLRSPERSQAKLASPLATSKPGAEALLRAVESGKLSARVLQDRGVKEKLVASKAENVAERIANLTKNLTPLNEQVQKIINQRSVGFRPGSASATRGAMVFEKNCIACHQLDGKGSLVGPQLDGLGARGAERIMEDLLDPNRNLDPAFRTTMFVLNDDEVVSGLFRREEGEQVVYAESTGKELSVPKKNIKERRQSELSLMPDNFADVVPASDFNDLIAFLLTKTGAKK